MSEPMSSGEIEDVLSSIRRLVSEDLRPAARPAARTPAADPAPPAREPAEKLLLTPALRVVGEAAAPAPEPEPEAEAEVEAAGPAPEPAFQSVRAPAAESVSALAAAMGRDAVQDEDGDEAPASTRAADWDDLEAAFIDVQDDDDAILRAVGQGASAPAAFVPVDADEAWDVLPEQVPQPDADLAEAEDWVPEQETEVEAHWQADEADVMDTPPPQARSWADAAEAEVLRELSSEAEADAVFGRIGDADDPVYDEELLRELVRDIIREELQGALGERITRNVRKLVRAEIARALAVRDFE